MIVSRMAKPDDFDRLGAKLSAFSARRQAPDDKPVSLVFQERAARIGVRGEAVITENWGKIDINLLFVEEKHRRKGFGTALVGAIEDFAHAHDVKSIRVNTPSWQGEGFYEHIGFTEMGRIPLAPDRFGRPQFEITYYKLLGQGALGMAWAAPRRRAYEAGAVITVMAP